MNRIFKIAWIVGVAAIVILVFSAGAQPVARAFAAAGLVGLAVVCLLRGIAIVAAGVGWFAVFPRAVRPRALTCVEVRFLREGANALLPFTLIGGNAIGARALALSGVPASLAAASVIVDVLLQASTQALFTLVGLATLAAIGKAGGVGGTIAVVIACAVPALAGFYFIQRPAGRRLVRRLLARAVGDRDWLSFGAVEALSSRLDALYANRAGLLSASTIHMAVWFLGALEIWAMLAFIGLPAGYPEALVIESLTQAIRGAAFAIPAGLGAQEGGFVAIAAIFGVPPDVAIAMSLIRRVPDFVFGVPSLVIWQMREGRNALSARPVAGEAEGR